MAENIIVQMNNKLETNFMVSDLEAPGRSVFQKVDHIHALTPYGMLLSSLGSCTALVIHTYAQNHHIHLDEVDINLSYERNYKQDCDNCENLAAFEEHISEEFVFHGDLTPQETDRLYKIAHQCPIHKMINNGIQIDTRLVVPSKFREEELKKKL